MHNHHLVPTIIGGPDTEQNQITLCESCHAPVHGHGGLFQDHSALTKAGLAAARARGVQLGSRTGGNHLQGHGYYKAGIEAQKVAADARAKDLADIFIDLENEGIVTANAQAIALNERGIVTARGGKWTARSVLNVKARL